MLRLIDIDLNEIKEECELIVTHSFLSNDLEMEDERVFQSGTEVRLLRKDGDSYLVDFKENNGDVNCFWVYKSSLSPGSNDVLKKFSQEELKFISLYI